jgi:hypothetical protein
MATPAIKNLEEKNAEYASKFTQGHLPLPPGKKYLVRTSPPQPHSGASGPRLSADEKQAETHPAQ